jgi:hypothetical protein
MPFGSLIVGCESFCGKMAVTRLLPKEADIKAGTILSTLRGRVLRTLAAAGTGLWLEYAWWNYT